MKVTAMLRLRDACSQPNCSLERQSSVHQLGLTIHRCIFRSHVAATAPWV
jgi:hypothetical protein